MTSFTNPRRRTLTPRGCAKPRMRPGEGRPLFLLRKRDQLPFYARLVNPGFPGEPFVIGPAGGAMGTREKDRTALKAFAIGFDAGRNRASRLRAFDQDCTHVDLLFVSSLIRCSVPGHRLLVAAPPAMAGARSDRLRTAWLLVWSRFSLLSAAPRRRPS